MQVWINIDRPITVEAEIPLKSEAPESVVGLYNKNERNNLIGWKTEDGKYLGCIKNNRSISVLSDESSVLSLYEERPARGAGWVGMTIKSSTGEILATLFQSRHSVNSLNWLKSTQHLLAKAFNLKEEYEDLGYNA
ncbi:hypothetical protein [Psychromonas sp. Urea-02u-13]|uniref:hypothetical protein n=1 Tax=Psychromonas sp. Urea-02u-13 TaxID=2058326 RepID=UPI000C338DEA|nr:hypothetical protein [Psychromonas sp. Urea-02u-13]PKG36976.1 hypothetical protein CXF74_21325 [Psychromonas sp. Urea-02u-13]